MSKKYDSLGDRMKGYENIARNYLTRRIPTIIRVDGKAFHTFTRGMEKPFDRILMTTMQNTMKYLCENIQGCVLDIRSQMKSRWCLPTMQQLQRMHGSDTTSKRCAAFPLQWLRLLFQMPTLLSCGRTSPKRCAAVTTAQISTLKLWSQRWVQPCLMPEFFYSKRRSLQLPDLAPARCDSQ